MFRYVSALIPGKAISDLELRWSKNALRSDLVLPSSTTLSNICHRGYSLTMDSIIKQLPSWNTVSLALDGWTSTNKSSINSVIAYYMNWNWALRDVQLAFDVVDCLFFSFIKSQLRMIGPGPTYWRNATGAFEGHWWSFCAYWQPFVGIMTDNASSNYSISRELQSTLQAAGIVWPALRNHIPCMAHIIQLTLGASMSCLGVTGRSKSWKAHEHDQQFGENESIDVGISQRLRREGYARINKVSAMRPGLTKIIEKAHFSRYFQSPEIDFHIAENASRIDYADTWSSKWVHWLSKSQSPHRGATYYGCKDTLELNTAVNWASLPITRTHSWVTPNSKSQLLLATLHITASMDHCQTWHGSCEDIPILDPPDFEEAYSHIASCYQCLQWHVPSYGWRYARFR